MLTVSSNEYSGKDRIDDEGQPGASAPLIAKFERFQVDSACISYWDVPHPGRLGTLLASTRHVCIACHDFLADEGGPEELRTKAPVRELLTAHGFDVRSRDDDPEPWTRDCLYGVTMQPGGSSRVLSEKVSTPA